MDEKRFSGQFEPDHDGRDRGLIAECLLVKILVKILVRIAPEIRARRTFRAQDFEASRCFEIPLLRI
jgi:hypothetical protein